MSNEKVDDSNDSIYDNYQLPAPTDSNRLTGKFVIKRKFNNSIRNINYLQMLNHFGESGGFRDFLQ